MQKVTIYKKSELFGNVIKQEVNLIEIGTITEEGPTFGKSKVVFRKPRSKYDTTIIEEACPWLVVVDGWNHPDPNPITRGDMGEGSRYSEFHSFYLEEGNELIAKNDFNILLDTRFTTYWSPYY